MIEVDHLCDQPLVGIVRGRINGRKDPTDNRGKIMGAKCQARHDAEPASAALQCPEEVGIHAGVGDLDVAISGHNLGFQKVARGHAEGLRQAAEATTVNKARDSDGQAAAALHVASGLDHYLVINVSPNRAPSN